MGKIKRQEREWGAEVVVVVIVIIVVVVVVVVVVVSVVVSILLNAYNITPSLSPPPTMALLSITVYPGCIFVLN